MIKLDSFWISKMKSTQAWLDINVCSPKSSNLARSAKLEHADHWCQDNVPVQGLCEDPSPNFCWWCTLCRWLWPWICQDECLHDQVDTKKLELGQKKCFKMPIGNNTSSCPTLMIDGQEMVSTDREKYLGDIISSSGQINENVEYLIRWVFWRK